MKNYKKGKPVFYIFFAYAVIYAGTFFVWEAMQQKLLSQKINVIREKTAKVEAENQRMSMKIADITSLNNLEETGKKRFGLVSPDVSGVVIIEDDVKK